jgi:hypothetical protein
MATPYPAIRCLVKDSNATVPGTRRIMTKAFGIDSDMKPPIILNEHARMDASGDLRVYDTIDLAEMSSESYDASDDSLHAFDSEGRLLKIVADQDGGAHLEPAEASPQHRDTLLKILRDFLVRHGEPEAAVEQMTLESLVKAARDKNPNPYKGQKKSK